VLLWPCRATGTEGSNPSCSAAQSSQTATVIKAAFIGALTLIARRSIESFSLFNSREMTEMRACAADRTSAATGRTVSYGAYHSFAERLSTEAFSYH